VGHVGDEVRLESRHFRLAAHQPPGRDDTRGDDGHEHAERAGEEHDLAADRLARRRAGRLVDREPPVGKRLAKSDGEHALRVADRRAAVDRAPLVVEHGDDRRRLERAERGLEDLAPQGVGIAEERRDHRLAPALGDQRQTGVIARDHLALALSRNPAHRARRHERAEDGLIAVQPRARIQELAARPDQIEPTDQRRAGQQIVERAGRRRA